MDTAASGRRIDVAGHHGSRGSRLRTRVDAGRRTGNRGLCVRGSASATKPTCSVPDAAADGAYGSYKREVMFIIDTSGSMSGPSIEQAQAALQLGVAAPRSPANVQHHPFQQ